MKTTHELAKQAFPTVSDAAVRKIAEFADSLRLPTREQYRRLVLEQAERDGYTETAQRLGIGLTTLFNWRKRL